MVHGSALLYEVIAVCVEERKGTSMLQLFREYAWVIPVLAGATCLLLIGSAICKSIGKRFHDAVYKAAWHLFDEQQVRQNEEREAAHAKSILELDAQKGEVDELIKRCSVLGLALCGVGEQGVATNHQFVWPPQPLEGYRHLHVELTALSKTLWQLDWMLVRGIAVQHEDSEFFRRWYEDLQRRYQEQKQQMSVFATPILEAIQGEAERLWRDVIAFTPDTSKHILLECQQYSLVQAQFALASAGRILEKGGSDAVWLAAGEYRNALIHFACVDAIRLVLRVRHNSAIDLSNPWVLAPFVVTFKVALAQKCHDDQITLARALEADRLTA
jgi:hypothetical protein